MSDSDFNKIIGKKIVRWEKTDDKHGYGEGSLILHLENGDTLAFRMCDDYGCDIWLDHDVTDEDLDQLTKGTVVGARISHVECFGDAKCPNDPDKEHVDDEDNAHYNDQEAVFYEIITSEGGATTITFRTESSDYYSSSVSIEYTDFEEIRKRKEQEEKEAKHTASVAKVGVAPKYIAEFVAWTIANLRAVTGRDDPIFGLIERDIGEKSKFRILLTIRDKQYTKFSVIFESNVGWISCEPHDPKNDPCWMRFESGDDYWNEEYKKNLVKFQENHKTIYATGMEALSECIVHSNEVFIRPDTAAGFTHYSENVLKNLKSAHPDKVYTRSELLGNIYNKKFVLYKYFEDGKYAGCLGIFLDLIFGSTLPHVLVSGMTINDADYKPVKLEDGIWYENYYAVLERVRKEEELKDGKL